MKLYKDKELNNEIFEVFFGELMAGNTKEYEFYVYNDSEAYLKDLSFKIDNKEVNITSFPLTLEPFSSSKLVIEWTPSATTKTGLKEKLKIEGTEVYKHK